MKRDLDVIRSLLLQVEDATFGDSTSNPWKIFSLPKIDDETVSYHVRILLERNMLHSESVILNSADSNGRPVSKFLPDALTDTGHEFLETVRDSEVWRKTKAGAGKAGSFGIDFVKDLAKGFLKTEVKKRTGIDIDD